MQKPEKEPATLKEFAYKDLGLIQWTKLDEIFDAVQKGHRKILIRSCNGAGKTAALAAICNWKLKMFPDSLIVTTASSHTQVKRNLWGEIRKQAKRANLYQPREITETLIKLTDKHYAIGISPALPQNAQGFHGDKMLIVVDEATGVSREIMNALFGNATGKDAQIILAYNPLDTDSYPFEAEHAGGWHQIHISAMDHPNVKYNNDEIPGAVSRDWINDMLPSWSYEVDKNAKDKFTFFGTHWLKTAEVSARILGEWSTKSGEGFIPMYLVNRSLEVEEDRGEKMMGLDIARTGKDETVFAFFDGNTQLPFHAMRSKDLVEIADKAEEFYKQGWQMITLDDTGLGGGVTDMLKARGIPCNPVNFGGLPIGFMNTEYRQFLNARAEMYFNLDRELKERSIKLTSEAKFHQELTAVRINYSGGQKYLLEDKSELRKRLGRSPDRADATVLARYGLKIKKKPKMVLFQ